MSEWSDKKNNKNEKFQRQDIKFSCQDGYILTATCYLPDKSNGQAILFAPATGIKRGFYNSLASYLALLGYGCLTFDNRGIGDSLKGSLKECKASIVDWGTQDLPSAFQELQNRFPEYIYHIVGHSAGGQLIGLIPDWQKIRSVFNVACSSGYVGNMTFVFGLQARFFLKIFSRMSNTIFGYTRSDLVGMGEPLPYQVIKDWNAWCGFDGGYVKNEFGKRIKQHWYDEISCPSLWLNAKDDKIANNDNVDDMTRIFKKMPIERIELSPKDEGFTEIGHMKFFSKNSESLWKYLIYWLQKHG